MWIKLGPRAQDLCVCGGGGGGRSNIPIAKNITLFKYRYSIGSERRLFLTQISLYSERLAPTPSSC